MKNTGAIPFFSEWDRLCLCKCSGKLGCSIRTSQRKVDQQLWMLYSEKPNRQCLPQASHAAPDGHFRFLKQCSCGFRIRVRAVLPIDRNCFTLRGIPADTLKGPSLFNKIRFLFLAGCEVVFAAFWIIETKHLYRVIAPFCDQSKISCYRIV